MAKKQTHRRSYLGHMLLLSLGVVLSVLMVSVFVVSFIFNRAVVDTVREDNEKLLRLTQKIEDNIFQDVFSNAVQLSADIHLQRWLKETKITSYSDLNNVKNRITQISNVCSYIDSIYVTFPALNLAVTDFGYFFRYDGMPDESWKPFATQWANEKKLSGWIGKHEIFHEKYGKPTQVIRLVIRLPFDGTELSCGWIIMNIAADYIENYLAQNANDYTRIAIWDESGKIICSSFSEEEEALLIAPGTDNFTEEQKIKGNNYLLEVGTSETVKEWIYVAYTDTASLNGAHRSIYTSIFFAMMVVAFLAIVVTYFSSRQMYHPIESLTNISKNTDEKSMKKIHSFTDLQAIYDTYSRAVRENKDLYKLVDRNRSMLKERFLVSLLLGYVRESTINDEYMAFLGFGASEGKKYILGLIYVEKEESEVNQMEIENIRQIVISDFLQEAAQAENISCYVAELASGILATILEMDRQLPGEKVAFALYDKLYGFIKESLRSQSAICVSDCVEGWQQLPSAYRQARDVMKFATDYNKHDLMMCSNFALQSYNEIDLPAYASKLIQAVRACRNEDLFSLLRHLRLEVENAQISREGSAVILSSIYNVAAISLSGEATEDTLKLQVMDFHQEGTVDDMFNRVLSNCLEFSNARAKQREMNLNSTSQKMQTYLEENYMRDISLAVLPQIEEKKHPDWMKMIREWQAQDYHPVSDPTRLMPHQVIGEVCNQCGPEAVYVTDVGQHQMWAAQYLRHAKSRGFITSGGLGTMGFGYGAAIGAQMALGRDQRVVMFTGDGSFHMNLNEACTAVSYELPIITVIFNNSVLGMVRQWQTIFYEKRYSQTDPHRKTDFVKLAEGFGLKGYRCRNLPEFQAAFADAMKQKGPTWIECIIDKDEKVLPMIPGGGDINDIIME